MKFPPVQLFAFVLALTVAPFVGAHAATQSLALLETDELTPLVCSDGLCQAEFSTYCLQKERDFPRTEAPYEVAAGSELYLVLTGVDGRVWRLPAAPHVRIATARHGHTAVIIELSQHALTTLNARRAEIEIGARVTLMPIAAAGDDSPQTEQDKRIATGPLRALGTRIVDRGPRKLESVRVLNQLVNALPQTNGIDHGTRKDLWRQTLKRGFQSASPERIEIAAREYKACWRDRAVERGGVSVRYCVERRHDEVMWNHVDRYWKAVNAGS